MPFDAFLVGPKCTARREIPRSLSTKSSSSKNVRTVSFLVRFEWNLESNRIIGQTSVIRKSSIVLFLERSKSISKHSLINISKTKHRIMLLVCRREANIFLFIVLKCHSSTWSNHPVRIGKPLEHPDSPSDKDTRPFCFHCELAGYCLADSAWSQRAVWLAAKNNLTGTVDPLVFSAMSL